MISHHSQFLARLNERLQSDLASSEQDPDDPAPHPGPEHSGQPGDGDQTPPEEIAGDDDAAYQEPLTDELVLLDDDVVHDDGRKSFRPHAAYDEPPPGDELIPLDQDEAYHHRQIALDDDAAYQEQAPGDQAAHERQWLNGGQGQGSATGPVEDSQDRQPLRRARARQYGLHAAALPVAIAFVALAGYGLGILSESGEIGAPLTRDTLRAWPTEPATASIGQNPLRAESDQPAEPSELVTVVVAPAPVAGVPEPAPAARVSTRALALPPPPKPTLRQSATVDVASAERQPAGVVADASAALLEAEGAGGPFVAQAMRPRLGSEAGTSGLGDSPPVPSLKPIVIASDQRLRRPVEQAAEPSELVTVRVAPAPVSLFASRPPRVRRAMASASVGGDGGDGSSSSGGATGGAGSSTSGGGGSKSGSGGTTNGGASGSTSGGGGSESGSDGTTNGGASGSASGGGSSGKGGGGGGEGNGGGKGGGEGNGGGKGGGKGGGEGKGGGGGGKGDGGGKGGGKGNGGGKGGRD
jgi:hypothetical protein